MRFPLVASENQRLRQVGDRNRDRKAWNEAVDAYTLYLQSNPKSFGIWVQLGNCAKEARRYDDAEAAYRSAIKLDATNADVHLQLGHLLKVCGKKVDALRHYKVAAQLDPKGSDAQNEIFAIAGTRGGLDSILDPLGYRAQTLAELAKSLTESRGKTDDVFTRYFRDFKSRDGVSG